jgi:hypothetical protein
MAQLVHQPGLSDLFEVLYIPLFALPPAANSSAPPIRPAPPIPSAPLYSLRSHETNLGENCASLLPPLTRDKRRGEQLGDRKSGNQSAPHTTDLASRDKYVLPPPCGLV